MKWELGTKVAIQQTVNLEVVAELVFGQGDHVGQN